MTTDPDLELEKTISDLLIRKLEIEKRILSAYQMGLGNHIIEQLLNMKEQVMLDLDYYMGIKRHNQETKGDDDIDGLIV
jgi:hypothetical protein